MKTMMQVQRLHLQVHHRPCFHHHHHGRGHGKDHDRRGTSAHAHHV